MAPGQVPCLLAIGGKDRTAVDVVGLTHDDAYSPGATVLHVLDHRPSAIAICSSRVARSACFA
jgi:hypothetical protein